MIVIVSEIVHNYTASRYLVDNIMVSQDEQHLVNFDIVDSSGKFSAHASLPISDIFTIKPKVLVIDL